MQISIQLHYHINVMQYLTLFIWRQKTGCFHYYCTQQAFDFISQREKSNNNIIEYNMGKQWCLCWKIHMCLCTVTYVSYVSVLLHYNLSRHKCTWEWKRGCIWNQYCWVPGHGKEMVDGINTVDKRYIYQLMSTVKLPGSIIFDSQIQM